MLSNDRRQQDEEEQKQNDFENEYHDRVQRLQHYVPFLRKMIDHLEGAKDKNRETQLTKIRSLLNILTDSRKKLKLTTIQRCEEILQKLYSKVEGTFEWSTELPCVQDKLFVDLGKTNPDREDPMNSIGSSCSPTVVESPLSSESSTRDDSSNSLWRRRKTAMDYFEETPRSPSPPSCAEVGLIPQPVVIPMERSDEIVPQPVMMPLLSKEDYFNTTTIAPKVHKDEHVAKPVTLPSERKEDFEAKWYQGESRCQDPSRQKNHFGMINSSLPSDTGIGHHNTSSVQLNSFTQDVPNYSSQNNASNSVLDIPNLEELRIQRRRNEFEYHGSDRASRVPVIDGGERYFKDYEHVECPSKEWCDKSLEGRRNSSAFQSQNESSQNSVIGSAHVYDYGHGQNSSGDSFDSSRELPGESENDKSKFSPKSASRVSIREKLALEINKVHRVGISLGGSLRSLSKDMGSPPHKKVEGCDAGQGNESVHRRNSFSGKEVEDNKSKDVERRTLGSVSQAGNGIQSVDSNAFIASTSSGKDLGCIDIREADAPLTSRIPSKSETIPTSNHKNSNVERRNSNDEHSEPLAQEVMGDARVLEEFSFRKKLLEHKLSPDQKIGPPTIGNVSSARVKSGHDEGQTSKTPLRDNDSDNDPKIPFLGSKDSVPFSNIPTSMPTFTVPQSSIGFSEQKHKSSPSISMQHSTSTTLQPFINPSNHSGMSPSQGSHREDSTQARNWNTPTSMGSPGVFPQFYPPNLTPQNINVPNVIIPSNLVHHNINSQNNLMQPSIPNPNHIPHLDNSHRAQHNTSQYLNIGNHPSHNMKIPTISQGPRPMGKGLLPDPVPQFRHGHCWNQGQNIPKMGLLPHPTPRPTWRSESYARPLMSKHVNESRQPVVASDVRSHHPRGSWNPRRGGFSKVNDPRTRNPDHSRSYSDSPEVQKKPEEKYCWKHPSDPRRASPAMSETKRPIPPVPKVTTVTTVSSPLNSLYDADQAPKTGKGYGLQKFRIPKIKSRESKDVHRHQNVAVAVTPTKEVAPCQKDKVMSTEKKKVEEERQEDSKNDTKEEDKKEEEKKEDTSKDNTKKESDKEEKERKSREDFTKELFQTLLKISLESQDGTKILENSKFLDELREKLKLNHPKKSRPIIESDSESSAEEEETSPVMCKTKKRCRVITESSESEEVDEEKNADEEKVESPSKPASAVRKPRSCKKSSPVENYDALGGRPRTRSQRKLFTVGDESEDGEKEEEKEKPANVLVDEESGDNQAAEEQKSVEETPDFEINKVKIPSRRTKRRSSLELLQEDIREMFICEGVMSATGLRMCRLLKEAAAVSHGNEDLSVEHTSGKESGECEDNSLSQNQSEGFSEGASMKLTGKCLNRKDKSQKTASLQLRVVLKKTEVSKDGCGSSMATHAGRRGGCARRSMKRRPNIGNRPLSNPEELNKSTLNESENEMENIDENKGNESSISCASEEMGSVSHSNTNLEGENEKQKNGKISERSLDKDEQAKLSECLKEENHSTESDILQNDAEKGNNLNNSEDESSPEAEGDDDQREKVTPENDEMAGTRGGRRKQNLKKRPKGNTKWALGMLKKAVNHKRKGLKNSLSSTIDEKSGVTGHSEEQLADIVLADINYTCNGYDSVKCRLCSYFGKQIVNHYVTKHPKSDVLVSRLSLEQARIAWDWTESNQGALKNAKQAFKSSGPFVCLMCEAWHSEYLEFYDHVTTHTGEYRFNCKLCPYRSFRDSNVRSHAYYVHHKKYSESADCYVATPVEELMHVEDEVESELGNSSIVIPGLVAHLCSKCNFVQILKKGVENHIALRHKEKDTAKILKIDMSLIAPEPPSSFFSALKDDQLSTSTKMTSEESNDAGGDETSMDSTFDIGQVKKEECDKTCEAINDNLPHANIKKEENLKCETKAIEMDYKFDEAVFIIDGTQCDPVLNSESTSVWKDLQNNPEFDEDISIVKLTLKVKIEEEEVECSQLDVNVNKEFKSLDAKGEVVGKIVSNQLLNEKKLAAESEKEVSGINNFGVISQDGCKEPDLRKSEDAESHASEVEIIEINDSGDSESECSSDSDSTSDSESSSDSDSSSDSTSSSGSASSSDGCKEWTAPVGIGSNNSKEKEKLFGLKILPDVKLQKHLLDITNRMINIKTNAKMLELKAQYLFGGGSSENEQATNDGEVENIIKPGSIALPEALSSESGSCDDDMQPKKFKIRVRCLSGDLLSSTKEPQIGDDLASSEPDSIVDVTGTSPAFEPDSDNTLCQISSVCSLHPNEEVPEEFIKAVSENETPDLTSLAAYSPSTSIPSSMYFGASDNIAEGSLLLNSLNGYPKYRPILPKPPSYVPPGDVPLSRVNCPPLNIHQPTGEGSSSAHTEKSDQFQPGKIVDPNPEELPSELSVPPPKQILFEQDGIGGKTVGQPPSQLKICSIMRACLYAKASKTPAVFSKVMSNQMKLCHLFKCMGRQCHFTTDESVVFLSHYLGHEALISDPVSSGTASVENSENHERKFDWQHCCYCTEMFTSASAYVKHVQVEHSECIYQCPYCFYRAAAVSYVILHQNSTHITEKVSVLQCRNPLKKSANEDKEPVKVQPNLEAYICYQGNCKRAFYSPNKYLTHLQVEHSAVSIYCCHKCSYQCFKADRLIQHYKLHSFYLYQCVYCDQGSDTSEEILQHLASFHPNKRASVCKRNSKECSHGAARTTGRHPYILYEDIELTEMENVDVIPSGEQVQKKPQVIVAPQVKETVSPRKKHVDESKENEILVDTDDGNTDDEGNLVIAEDLDDEMPMEENEVIKSNADKIIENDAHEQSIMTEKNLTAKGSQKENTEGDRIGEVIQVDDEPWSECEEKNRKEGGRKQAEERMEGMSESEGDSRAEVRVTSSQDGSTEPPDLKGKGNQSSTPPVFQQTLDLKNSEKSQVVNNRKNLNSTVSEVEIVDVNEGNQKTSATEELRRLRKREAAARANRIPTRSQVESKQRSASDENHSSSGTTKENVSLKEAANRKVDRAKLYQCCFSGCTFLANDCNHLKYHIKDCSFSKNNNTYTCPHCSRLYKSLPPMLKHLRVHGKKSYVCMVCPYKCSFVNQALQHVKSRHRAQSTTVNPLADWEEPEEIAMASKDHKLIVVAPKEVSMSFLLRKRFVPEDADYLPFPCIYSRDAKCTKCSYSTKIRSNMRRHLHLHMKFSQTGTGGGANQVPWSVKDFVNPMPCLEGKEMMFDKMTNWAISSHLDAKVKEEEENANESRRNSVISEYEEDNFLPRYVPENERYVCGVVGCHYQTVDDTMLRHHLRALHREEVTFRCAHCPDDQNVIHQVPVDRLASHLKMHDDQLYQCVHCNYFHFQRRFVERHTIDKHSEMSHMINIIREPDTFSRAVSGPGSAGMAGTGTDGSIRSSNPSGSNEMVKYESDNIWNCGICSYSCSIRESISDHARISHSIYSQYVCGMCTFRSAYISAFNLHFSLKHLGYPVQLVANYFRNNISVLAPPTVTIALPNGKVIFPPNPILGKAVDPRSEPVIEVWPFVEKGFGKSSSSSVRLKELNTTYPWQRCMPRVRYIRGIPIADEGEETMYDLAESLKVKDEIRKDEIAEGEAAVHATKSDNTGFVKTGEVNVIAVATMEGKDALSGGVLDNLAKSELKKGGKRRMSDPLKTENVALDVRKRSDSGRSLTPMKASPNKKLGGRSVSMSPSCAKLQKIDTSAAETPSICSQSDIEESDVEIVASVRSHGKPEPGGDRSFKLESLKKLYGEYGESEGNLFVCPICHKYKTKHKADMKEHLYRELNYKRFVCTNCGFLAPAKKMLQKHYLRVHKRDGKLEAIAELPPDKDIELWVHHALDDQLRVMKRKNRVQARGSALLEEISGVGSTTQHLSSGEGSVNKNMYSCKSCTSRFSTIRGAKFHFKISHLKLGSWICGHCDVSANSQALITRHTKSCHPSLEEIVICNHLSTILDAKSLDDSVVFRKEFPLEFPKGIEGLADSSLAKNPQDEIFLCSLCDYQTNQADDLKRHESIHPELQTYCCSHCSYAGDQECHVMDHYAKEHLSVTPNIIKRSDAEKSQLIGKGNIGCPEPANENGGGKTEEVAEEQDDVKILEDTMSEPETLVTLENIGELGKANASFFFKCYYCRMKSYSCDEVVNHWENIHLPTDIRSTHPFKCKRIFTKNPENNSTLPPQVYQCTYCNEIGTIYHLKGHFKTAHPESDFKVFSLQNIQYCCILCDYLCNSFKLFESHFKVTHPFRDLEYKMKLDDGNDDNPEKKIGADKAGASFKGSSKRESVIEEKFLKDAVFCCFVCNVSYLAFNVLERHHSQSHSFFPFKYSIEVKSAKSEGSGPSPAVDVVNVYHCPTCYNSMNSFIDMIQHIRHHVLPYRCGSCSFQGDLPSKVSEHHFSAHPVIQNPIIISDSSSVTEMSNLYKKITVTSASCELQEVTAKRRAPSPLLNEPKKHCAVARKSTTQVFQHIGALKPTARKSTNPSPEFIRNLKTLKDSPQVEEIVLDDDLDMEAVMSDEDVGSVPRVSPEIKEFSYYTGGKGCADGCVNLSRITVCMTFGGCAAKRVPVSKMAQLVDLEPCLLIGDVCAKLRSKRN